MTKLLLTTLGLAALTTAVNAQQADDPIRADQPINCFQLDLDPSDTGPLGTNIPSGGDFSFSGNLSGNPTMPDISGFSINANIFSNGGTTASLNSGVLTFTGNVAILIDSDSVRLPEGKDLVDFSYNVCTVIDRESTLFQQLQNSIDRDVEIFFGDARSGELVSVKDAFTQDEKGGFVYNRTISSKDTALSDGSFGSSVDSFFIRDERGLLVEIDNSNEVSTVLKDFTVCVDCVPEPSSTALLGLGAMSLLIRRKR